MVETEYADGRVDKAFPLSLSYGRHIVSGQTDAYVIPADGSRVKCIRIHNRKLETDFAIAAVTVNETENRLHTRLPAAPEKAPTPARVRGEKSMRLNGDELTVQNGALMMKMRIFFNGEAIYDSFWDTEESRGLEFTVKAYKIKKKYAACFACDHPETMIDTLTHAVVANKFPSGTKTVYTLYNSEFPK